MVISWVVVVTHEVGRPSQLVDSSGDSPNAGPTHGTSSESASPDAWRRPWGSGRRLRRDRSKMSTMKLHTGQVGAAGEHFVAAEVHIRGGYAVTFSGNMK